MKIAITIIQLICAVALIVIVLLQSGKSAGLSSVLGGNTGGFGAQAKAKTLDAKLARYTKWVALGFVLLTFILDLI